MKGALARVDSSLPPGQIRTMDEVLHDTLAQRRLNTLLLSLFGGVALLLALIGIYGVMSYTVTQRVQEIGIRMALGARPGDVVRMVVRSGLVLAAAGVAVGLLGAVALTRLMKGLLFGVSATDPSVYAVIAVLLVGVAGLASFLPARRAAHVDPMIALRSD
jgi:ABC-type antimicrobial peptide transport system permease subunit